MQIGAGMKRIKSAASKIVFDIAFRMADFSVNSLCYSKYYQEKLDPQTEILKKYYTKESRDKMAYDK